jgi:hypothetical protein
VLVTIIISGFLYNSKNYQLLFVSNDDITSSSDGDAIIISTTGHDDRQLGTVIFLAPPRHAGSYWKIDRFCLFLRAVRSVDEHLNRQFGPYPIHILLAKDYELDPDGKDGPYTKEDRALIQRWAPHSTIIFVEIYMYSEDALEPDMTVQQAKTWKDAMPPPFHHGVGYASMCRLWSGRLQQMEFLQQHYQYYMRMDDDSLMIRNAPYDPFVKMKNDNLVYVYRRDAFDTWGVKQLWKTVKPLVKVTSHTPFAIHGKPVNGRYPNAEYNGYQPYNNFHVSAVSFWSSAPWRKVWNAMNRNHLFFRHRVGDANVHAVACMVMKPEQVTIWIEFPYRHNSNDMGDEWIQQGSKDECQAAYRKYIPNQPTHQELYNMSVSK